MTRPARHVPWAFFFCALAGAPYFDKSTLFSPHTKTYPVQHLRPPPSRLSVPRGKPRKDPRRYRRKRKLPRPERLPPKAATRRGECRAGAGASLRASALPCVSPPGSFVRRERDTWTGRAPVLRLCLEQARFCSRPAGVLHGLPCRASPTLPPPPLGPRRGGTGDGRRKEAQAIAKQHITTLYPRDVRALSALARCGYVTADQLRENGLRDKRIHSYCKDGLVERVTHSRPGDREADRECFRLSKAGRDLCREELSCRLYNAQNPAHDLCLSDRYHAISPEERATWKTESECRDIFTEHIQQLRDQGEEERAQELWDQYQDGRISMPDAMYTRSDGVTIAFEVITNNYGEAEISAKEEAAEELGATIEYCTA